MGLIRRAVIVVVVLIAVCAFAAVYQAVGNWLDARSFPQRGRSVQAGAVRLNIDCSGDGRPVVILDSGYGVPAIGWSLVQPKVAQFTRVCSYDRAGYGWSDLGPAPRTGQQIASELHALLQTAGEHGPFVLVGHSFAGYIVRLFTSAYPEDVGGVVLVDGGHEDEGDRIEATLPDAVKQQLKARDDHDARVERYWGPIRHYLGVDRARITWGLTTDEVDEHTPRAIRSELLHLVQEAKFRRAVGDEAAAFDTTKKQVREAGTLGDRPLAVLTSGHPYDSDPLIPASVINPLTELWITFFQVQEVNLSTRGRQIVLSDSSHMIPYDKPEAVVSAIQEVWTATRGQGTRAH